MNCGKLHTDKTGTWIIYLALFSLGVDGLAYLLYTKDRAASLVTIPILITWQAVVFVFFFRSFLPAYSSLDETHCEHGKALTHLFQICLTLPVIVAIVTWAMLSTSLLGYH
jgi:hypothetical protein